MESVAETDCVRSMELVEVNPTLDQHNETAELATELAEPRSESGCCDPGSLAYGLRSS